MRILFLQATLILYILGYVSPSTPEKLVIAHRGASAYAPEHTIAAYRLAIEHGSDFVEQDLQITKDGVLVCLHDETLERTTNVEDVFPDRAVVHNGVRRWYVADFTLEEVRRLDAGSWFGKHFQGERVPTFLEAIDIVKGRAGLYPETKAPETYARKGFSMEKLLISDLKKHGLERRRADARTPVIIQSFSKDSLIRLRKEENTLLPLVWLIGDPGQVELNGDGFKQVRKFADGIGPEKNILLAIPQIVRWAHEARLTVTPYTFRAAATGRFESVREEMAYFLHTLGVDAVFTDNPDQFPRTQ